MHHVTQPVKFRNIIIPDDSFFFENGTAYFTNDYLESIEQIRNFALKNKTPVKNEKLYFYYGRVSLNETRLANYFQEKGYELIRPETLPFSAQLNLLINCKSFASTVGSCAHNIIFTQNKTEVILIPRRPYLNGYQTALNQMHDKNIFYVDASLSIFAPNHLGYFFYILSKQLRQYFGDEWNGEYTTQDFEDYIQYLAFAQNHGLKVHTESLKYYNPVLFDFINQLKNRSDLVKKYKLVFT